MKAASSLRASLLRWLLLPLLAIAPGAVALQYELTLRPALAAFDRSLGDAAISVANSVRWADGRLRFEMSAQTERSIRTNQSDTIFYAVLGPRGELVAGDGPLAEPPGPALRLSAQDWRYWDAELFGQRVRVAALGVACGDAACQVRVAETRAKRAQLRRDMFTASVATLLLYAAATAVVVLVAARRGLAPLERLSTQLAARHLADLRPVAVAGVPAEAQPVVDAVNRLFDRVRAGSVAQQAFLADAAHQLRTPLAALRTEAELALLQPHPPALHGPLQRLDAAARRAARLASQLLALARADPAAAPAISAEAVDLKALAAEAADEWVPRAIAAGVDLGFDLEPARTRGQAFLLRELLANLLHNALEHGGRGTAVTVRTRPGGEGAGALLEVEDTGPGIAAADRERVLQRFQRGSGAAAGGSGLGLAIVRDIAAAHGAALELAAGGGGRGLAVRVRFGAR